MTQEIEIEYKVLLTENEYNHLLTHFSFPQQPIKQVNHYFETADHSLMKKRCALRIREKNDRFKLTLKEPHAEGILETHDILTHEEANAWLNGNIIKKEHIAAQLQLHGLSIHDLMYYGSLTTYRREVKQNELLYVLDESIYNNIKDYELEIEAPTKEEGKRALQTVLENYHITPKKPITKQERFFQTYEND